jgi:ParB family chromosome partitioning protein
MRFSSHSYTLVSFQRFSLRKESGMELEIGELDLRYKPLRVMNPDLISRLATSMHRKGQRSPVVVVQGEEGRYVLIDGYLRIEALKAICQYTVEAVVMETNVREALLYVLQAGERRRRGPLVEGWFVRELIGAHGMTQAEMAERLSRSVSWVSRRLALVQDLPEAVQKLVHEGAICAHAAMKYLVPLARANKEECLRVAEQLKGLSERDIRIIYDGVRKSRGERRERIVEKPLLYLKAVKEKPREQIATEEDFAEVLYPQVAKIKGLLEAMGGLLDKGKAAGIRMKQIESFRFLWMEGYMNFFTLLREMKEVLDAQLRDTGSNPQAA